MYKPARPYRWLRGACVQMQRTSPSGWGQWEWALCTGRSHLETPCPKRRGHSCSIQRTYSSDRWLLVGTSCSSPTCVVLLGCSVARANQTVTNTYAHHNQVRRINWALVKANSKLLFNTLPTCSSNFACPSWPCVPSPHVYKTVTKVRKGCSN